MKRLLVLGLLILAACDDSGQVAVAPKPAPLTRDAVGHFCGMIVEDHSGPKAQAFVSGQVAPYWFTSVRDARAFSLLPESDGEISAIYVTDMARAASWDEPGEAWMGVEDGYFVVNSSRMGGMGQPEAVPFSTRNAAEDFAAANGGEILRWDDIPQSYVLGEATPHQGESLKK